MLGISAFLRTIMAALDDVLKIEKKSLLVDTGLFYHRFSELKSHLYNCLGIEAVDPSIVRGFSTSLREKVAYLLQIEDVHTIREVTREIDSHLRGIKIKYARMIEGIPHKKGDKVLKPGERRYRQERAERSGRKERVAMSSLLEAFNYATNASHEKELMFLGCEKQYEILKRMIRLLSITLDLKKDWRSHEKNPYKSDTDESLVAALYCISMYDDKKPVVISVDYDIKKILRVTPVILCSSEFHPYNQDLIEGLHRNPFQAYILDDKSGQYNLEADSTFVMNEGFWLTYKDREKSQLVREKLQVLWKSLYEYQATS